MQQALALAGVGELDGVARLCLREQIAFDGNRRIVCIGFVHARDEPHARPLGHAADRIALRSPLRDRRAGFDRAGAQLRPARSNDSVQRLPVSRSARRRFLTIRAQTLAIVVGAVDAHDFHARFDQVANQRRLIGRLARHRHHDPRRAVAGRCAEDRVGVLGEQRVAGVERDWRRVRDLGGTGWPRSVQSTSSTACSEAITCASMRPSELKPSRVSSSCSSRTSCRRTAR